MLHDFIAANREQIIERARRAVRERTAPKSVEAKLEHGIPLFLTQLADALVPVPSHAALHLVGPREGSNDGHNNKRDADAQRKVADANQSIVDTAALHGHELLRHGFTVAQVVHGYGDVCQVVTSLATEKKAAISAEDFHVFNRCLDDAIAGAVTAFGKQREEDLAYQGTERLGVLAHELRNLLNTAILSFDVIKKGLVGVSGSTGTIHSRSLTGLRALAERSLAEVRLEAGMPMLESVLLVELIEEVEVGAAMQAEGYGLRLKVNAGESDVAVNADRQLLMSAVSNLLQNAFKFTRASGCVSLTTRATADRVLIDVSDECGGLPPGAAKELFRPFVRSGSDASGLGLGLSIALRAVQANGGDIRVCDVPGTGCVFTIDLPRQPAPPEAESVGARAQARAV